MFRFIIINFTVNVLAYHGNPGFKAHIWTNSTILKHILKQEISALAFVHSYFQSVMLGTCCMSLTSI